MKNIQFVTVVHGNEPIPVLALASLGVNQIVANPKALQDKVRFIEKDLNASFGTGGETYEEKRARELLRQVLKDKLILDLHTFSAKSEPFVVIVDLKMLNFARSLGFKRIVYMNHNIKRGHALINYKNGVSVELGEHNDPKSFERTIKLVKRIRNGNISRGKSFVYEVYGIIKDRGDYENFKLFKNKKESFYPILAGEKAYDFYGLKAKILKGL
jgi:succinylglutamate desuccinylase